MMLLLFDIDGTLLGRAGEAHRDALYAALLKVHGIETPQARGPLFPAGRTDGEIARTLLLQAGVSARQIDERARDVQLECSQAYARLCPADLSDKVLPGIAELLEWLGDRDDVKLALVTGNYEAVGRLKLARAGIGHYFASGQGAFGSDSEDRAALPPLARRRAGTPGSPYPRERTIVIGDTPRDIACAQADGLRSFAVASGPYKAEELTTADAVAPAAGQLRPLLEQALAVT
ncbi:MAG TPA: haloacid dehalogenase-like hydrolase [Solirubrobacteraceae bacterium]